MRFFATAAKGTEPALRDELRELRLRRVRADRGGVHFEGEILDAARACLWSRVAVRILLELSAFEAKGERALYDGVRSVDWSTYASPGTTLAVRASCRSSELTHTQFIAQRTKDAIVDSLRDRFGSRPDVHRDDPDVLVAVHLLRDLATLYLDVGGASLHARGWRPSGGEAPLKETLAAAVVRLSGWDRDRPFIDPMCGAGTIAIEAACWAHRIAPGLSRERFGFERWVSWDAPLRVAMSDLREEARAAAVKDGPTVIMSDSDAYALAAARDHARAAGVEVRTVRQDVRKIGPLVPAGFVVTNPPYGARLESSRELYVGMARALSRLDGHTVAILAGTPEIERAMRRKPDR